MHEFTEKFGMTFANFLDLGPHSQPKRKLINISGERGHYLYLHKKGLHLDKTFQQDQFTFKSFLFVSKQDRNPQDQFPFIAHFPFTHQTYSHTEGMLINSVN